MQNILVAPPRVEAVDVVLEASDGTGDGARSDPPVEGVFLPFGGGGGIDPDLGVDEPPPPAGLRSLAFLMSLQSG